MSNREAGNKPVTGIGYSSRGRLQSNTQRLVFRYSAHKSVLFVATLYTHMVATADHLQMVATAEQD